MLFIGGQGNVGDPFLDTVYLSDLYTSCYYVHAGSGCNSIVST